MLMAYKDLRDKFGAPLAKNMLEEKKAMQKGKSKNDPVTYWMEHPDIKNNQDLVVHQNYACVTRLFNCKTVFNLSHGSYIRYLSPQIVP